MTPPVPSAALHWIKGGLERTCDGTRLRAWPEGAAWRIGALALARDSAHVRLFLDAAETFHPGSEVSVISMTPLHELEPLAPDSDFPRLARVNFLRPADTHRGACFDMLALLHPHPYHDSGHLGELALIRPWFNRIRAARKWMLYRNLELWDGSWGARLKRRLLLPLLNPLIRRALSRDAHVLKSLVEPRLPHAMAWNESSPCAHVRAETVFDHPRHIRFCPDCGMGLTPREYAPAATTAPDTYGPGYARHYLYCGRREWDRYVAESCARVSGYLDSLNFSSFIEVPGRVLDFGCGNGRYAPLWMGRGWDYCGADTSAANIEAARKFVADRKTQASGTDGEKAAFLLAGIESEEIRRRAPFDLVFLSHVLEHIAETRPFLDALRSLTRPGGLIYVEVPDARHHTWNMRHRGYANTEHYWDFTPAMLRATIQSAGWSVVGATLDLRPEDNPFQAALARNP